MANHSKIYYDKMKRGNRKIIIEKIIVKKIVGSGSKFKKEIGIVIFEHRDIGKFAQIEVIQN